MSSDEDEASTSRAGATETATSFPTSMSTASTAGSRNTAPSKSPTKAPIYHWCRFESEDLPYRQPYVQSLLSIFYRCHIDTEELHHLSETQQSFLFGGGSPCYPITFKDKLPKAIKKIYELHHDPFLAMAQSVLLASMKECNWDLWQAYSERLKSGLEGYYREPSIYPYPSWRREVKEGVSITSQIIVPDDVVYRTVAALFGFWGLDMPEYTPEDRRKARRKLRIARKDRRDFEELLDLGPDDDGLSDPESDEDRHYMEDEARDPRHVPTPLSDFCREDCLLYVRSLAYRFIYSNLTKKVSRHLSTLDKAKATALALEKGLRVKVTDLHYCPPLWNPDDQSEEAFRKVEKKAEEAYKKERADFFKKLKLLNTNLNTCGKSFRIIDPWRYGDAGDEEFQGLCASLHELAGQYDLRLQIDAQGHPELLHALYEFRQTDFYLDAKEDQALTNDAENQDVVSSANEGNGCLTVLDTQDTSEEQNQAETKSLGISLFGLIDKSAYSVLMGCERGTWPGINKNDSIYGTLESPIPIVLRDHCSEGAIEIVSRAFQHSDRQAGSEKLDTATDYSTGCIIADDTGMGKTLQAMQVITLFAHLAIKYHCLLLDPPDSMVQLPPVMLADRKGFRDYLSEQRRVLGSDYDPSQSIDRYMSKIRKAFRTNKGSLIESFGSFAHIPTPVSVCEPNIIVAPPALIEHWRTELSRFTSDTLIVVHLATQASSSRSIKYVKEVQLAWDVEETRLSGVPTNLLCPARLVVLVSSNLLSRLWAHRQKQEEASHRRDLTPFDIAWSTMIVDEVHLAKSKGSFQSACHALSKKAAFRIGQSATPVVNSPLDMCLIANALGFPQANDVANPETRMDIEETDELPTIPKFYQEARYRLGVQRRLDRSMMSHSIPLLYRILDEPAPGNRPSAFLSGPITNQQPLSVANESVPHKLQMDPDYVKAANDVFGLLGPYLIRRSKQALTPEGKKMLKLGKLSQTTINVQLRDDEIEDVNEYLERVCVVRKETLGADKAYENELGYYGPTYAAARAATIAPSYFVRGLPQTPEELSKHRTSSKLNAVIDIIDDALEEDIINNSTIEDANKIAIHCDSRKAEPAVLFELAIRGHFARVYNGTTKPKERRRIEAQVNKDQDHPASSHGDGSVPKTRILFCSPVAGVGINFFRANIVINLTTPWSFAAYEQRIGRHYRPPPSTRKGLLNVRVYNILAINTSDIVNYTAAALKAQLNITCFRHPNTHEIQRLLAPEEDKGARKKVKQPHRLPSLPQFQRSVDLSAIDYNLNRELLANSPQFKTFEQLQVVSTLRHLHLHKRSLDYFVIEAAKNAVRNERQGQTSSSAAHDEVVTIDDAVALGYVPAEMAESEDPINANDQFRAHVDAAVRLGRQAKGSVQHEVLLTREDLRRAEKMSYTEWEQSAEDATARKIEVQKSQLRQFEARVWSFIRSLRPPLPESVRQRHKEFDQILYERNRLAWRLNYLRIFQLPDRTSAIVQWIQSALDSNQLYPNSVIVTRPNSPDPPRPSIYRPPSTPDPITQSSIASQTRDWSPEPAHPGPPDTYFGMLTRPPTPNPASQTSASSQPRDWTPQESSMGSDPYDRYTAIPTDPNVTSEEESMETPSQTQSSMPSLVRGTGRSKGKPTPPSSPLVRHRQTIDQETGNLDNHMYQWMRHFHGGNPVPLSKSFMMSDPLTFSPPSSVILGTPGGSQANSDEDSSDPKTRNRRSTMKPSRLLDHRNLYVPPGATPVDPYAAIRIQNEETRRQYLMMEAHGAIERPKAPTPESKQRRKRQREESSAPSGPAKVPRLKIDPENMWEEIGVGEMDMSLNELGSVIGHRRVAMKGLFEPIMEYLVQDFMDGPENARWIHQDSCGGYPVQKYLDQIPPQDQWEGQDVTPYKMLDLPFNVTKSALKYWTEDGSKRQRALS